MKSTCRKLITLHTLACVLSSLTTAQASVALMIYSGQADSPSAVIVLAEKPTVTFTGDSLHIVGVADDLITADVALPLEPGARIEFDEAEVTQDIEEEEDIAAMPFRFEFTDGQTVRINGLADGERILVYSVDGRQHPAGIERSMYGATIHLDLLPKGYYIIRTEKHSFKIYKK